MVIKLGALGDFIQMIDRMFWIKEQHPDASLTLMTGSMYVKLARHMGIFDSFIVDNRTSYWNVADKLRLCREVKSGDFDCVYDLQSTSRTRSRYFGVFRYMSRKSFTWMDLPKLERRIVTYRGAFRKSSVESSSIERVIAVKRRLDFLKAAPGLLESLPHPYVLMIPGCSPTHPHKRWPAESFAALAQKLAEHHIHTVVIGTKAEATEVNCVAEASPFVVSLLNKTAMSDIADLARHALASVGNDTGPSHIVANTESPLIGLFAARKKPCSLKGERTHNLISSGTIDLITPDEVWDALLPYIDEQLTKK